MDSSSFLDFDFLDEPKPPPTPMAPEPIGPAPTLQAIRRMAYTAENVITPLKGIKVKKESAGPKKPQSQKSPRAPRPDQNVQREREAHSKMPRRSGEKQVKASRRGRPPNVDQAKRSLSASESSRLTSPPPSRFEGVDPSVPLASGKSAVASRPYTYQPAPSSSRYYETALLRPHELPAVYTSIDNHWLYIFFRFCAERHRMQVRRVYEGVARDKLSTDETMTKESVGNIYREMDSGSVRMRAEIMDEGEQTAEEVCFRVFLFCGFYTFSTWQALRDGLGHTPSWKLFKQELPKYEQILYGLSFVDKKTIYTSAFQLVPPTRFFKPSPSRDVPHFAATLRLVLSLMEMGLPRKLMQCNFALDASAIFRTIPTFGSFLSLNLVCYLNDTVWYRWPYRDFASCGPGSRSYLQHIFGPRIINNAALEQAGLQWMYDNQWRYWKRIGVDPPHAWELGVRPGMRVLDIENALCWCHRYVLAYLRLGYGSLADLPHPAKPEGEAGEAWDEASQPAWCEEKKWLNGVSRARLVGDYEEKLLRTKRIKGELNEENDADGEADVERAVQVGLDAYQDPGGSVGDDSQLHQVPVAGSAALPPESAAEKRPDGEGEDVADEADEEEDYKRGEVFEVERIVQRLGTNRADEDALFRVRWKGYMPEDDTWERGLSLRQTAGEALQEYLDWEDNVSDTIERIKREFPYRPPADEERKRGAENGEIGRGKRLKRPPRRD